jgi:hypothetical protein
METTIPLIKAHVCHPSWHKAAAQKVNAHILSGLSTSRLLLATDFDSDDDSEFEIIIKCSCRGFYEDRDFNRFKRVRIDIEGDRLRQAIRRREQVSKRIPTTMIALDATEVLHEPPAVPTDTTNLPEVSPAQQDSLLTASTTGDHTIDAVSVLATADEPSLAIFHLVQHSRHHH